MNVGNNTEKQVPPLLVVLSGPSGVGKDTVLIRMRQLRCQFHYVVTATTRKRRGKEKEEKDYHFLSRGTFQRMIDEGEFLEWAEVYGNFYGVPKEEMRQALAKGMDVMVKVDVQGAATIKKQLPQSVCIFLNKRHNEAFQLTVACRLLGFRTLRISRATCLSLRLTTLKASFTLKEKIPL